MMGRAISWLAYIWLITTETGEELFYRYISDYFRRLRFTAERREQASELNPRVLHSSNAAAKATDIN